jgi:enoyl-CoA hydratase
MSSLLQTREISAKTGEVVVLTMDRPPVNALNSGLLAALDGAFRDLGDRNDVRGLVITGAGKAFVAGADISQMQALSAAEAAQFAARGQAVFNRLAELEFPVIAAVNGFALGGGCELAMACDLILAGPRALFGQPEVKLGVIPGFGGTQRLPRLVGVQRARELCFTGRTFGPEEAVAMGLALRQVEGDLVEEAVALAQAIAANGPQAVAWTKKAMHETDGQDLSAGLRHERDLFGLCFSTADQEEGMAAFLEKRDPRFTGN